MPDNTRSRGDTVSAMHSVVSAVVGYAERGWRVVPLASNGRSPLIELARIVGDRVSDAREIRHWWQIWPYAAVGIATGQPSRLVVVSVPRDPFTSVRRLEWRRGLRRLQVTRSLPGDLPRTAVVSHAGRLHYYYTAPEGPIPTYEVGDILIFGEAGVVVAPPPSIHGDSPRWECALSATAVSLAPDWVAELATI